METNKEVITEKEPDQWLERELLSTRKKIELNEIQIAEINRLDHLNKEDKQRTQKAVYLDLYHADKLDEYFQREAKISSEILALDNEREYLQEYYELLLEKQKKDKIVHESHIHTIKYAKYDNVYKSPIKGTITQVLKENYEVALESEVIMTIHKPSNLFIKAFYKQKDVKHLREGDIVSIVFPDGTKSEGVLQRFYSATFALPSEFQKTYEPVTRSISADIVPLNEFELEKWKPFYKLNVKIRKRKFNFLDW